MNYLGEVTGFDNLVAALTDKFGPGDLMTGSKSSLSAVLDHAASRGILVSRKLFDLCEDGQVALYLTEPDSRGHWRIETISITPKTKIN